MSVVLWPFWLQHTTDFEEGVFPFCCPCPAPVPMEPTPAHLQTFHTVSDVFEWAQLRGDAAAGVAAVLAIEDADHFRVLASVM